PPPAAAPGALRPAGRRPPLVLTDFLWFSPARVVNGVRLGGRRDHVRDPLLRARLLAEGFQTIAVRYGQGPAPGRRAPPVARPVAPPPPARAGFRADRGALRAGARDRRLGPAERARVGDV